MRESLNARLRVYLYMINITYIMHFFTRRGKVRNSDEPIRCGQIYDTSPELVNNTLGKTISVQTPTFAFAFS